MDPTFLASLQTCLQSCYASPAPVVLHELNVITTGWESEIYTFNLEHGPADERTRTPLALRLYTGGSASRKAANEFASLQRLGRAGYPVPRVDCLETDPARLGRPFILMAYIPGPTLGAVMGAADEAGLSAWIEQFCALFVRLHRLDWRQFVDDPDQPQYHQPYTFLDQQLTQARQYQQRFSSAGFSAVLDWLEARRERMACRLPAPIHYDFHPNNILVQPDGRLVVIDWSSFGVSDPRFDLAWTLMLADAYRGEAWRTALLAAYERLSGAPLEAMDEFLVFACLSRLTDLTVSFQHGADQMGMRPEAVEAMRQAAPANRRVYNLLRQRTGLRIPAVESWLDALPA